MKFAKYQIANYKFESTKVVCINQGIVCTNYVTHSLSPFMQVVFVLYIEKNVKGVLTLGKDMKKSK